MGKFVVYKTDTGYLFHLKAGNGETIGTSEIYTSLAACRTGIASVQKNAPSAALVDMTVALVKSAENLCKDDLIQKLINLPPLFVQIQNVII